MSTHEEMGEWVGVLYSNTLGAESRGGYETKNTIRRDDVQPAIYLRLFEMEESWLRAPPLRSAASADVASDSTCTTAAALNCPDSHPLTQFYIEAEDGGKAEGIKEEMRRRKET